MTTPNPLRVVAQHNALINARFSFEPLQMRLFLALLARIEFEDADFAEHLVPFSELVSATEGGSAYRLIDQMCQKLTSFTIYIEQLEAGPSRRRSKKPHYEYIPLMAKITYDADRGGVVAIFNPLIMPYLLQLRQSGNFTTAKLLELSKLKSPYSLRIYWLLKEYAAFGQRTMSVDELRFLLDIADGEYPRFANFKARILDRARSELAATDLPFSFELQRRNQMVQKIKFLLQLGTQPETQLEDVKNIEDVKDVGHGQNCQNAERTEWEHKLLDSGLSRRSLTQIRAQLQAGDYPLEYVHFVLQRVGRQVSQGKIRKPAGAIYKALVDKYLLDEFRLSKPAARGPAPSSGPAAGPSETRIALAQVQQMYEQPGPYLQKLIRDLSFEQYLHQVYLSQGFVLQTVGQQQWLVKPPARPDRT